ncbi:DNA-processing protein DprA [Trichothermofontia sp.]
MSERAFWLTWSQIEGLGTTLIRRLAQQFGSLATAWEADLAALGRVEGIGPQLLERIVIARRDLDPATLLAEHQRHNPHFWLPIDPDYPRLLLEIPSPPSCLYYHSIVDPAEITGQIPAIAIVGTREPSEYGRRWTRRIATALARQGVVVVSGMAEGIDTEAHTACLEAGGRTIAVLGTGVDQIYPRRNQELYHRILKQGWVTSEYPAGTQPDRLNFPRRNRIIAGLARAVLVMEAPAKSGALITAYQANEFGREVYVLPGSLDNPRSHGCLGLLQRGAQVILNEGQLLEHLGAIPALDTHPLPIPQAPPNLEPKLARVLAAVTTEATSLDQIVVTTGMETGMVSSALMQLEMLDLVTQLPGLRYRQAN